MGTAEQRITLFRSLFRGRDDAYAIRWESVDGRSGYMPKADRDWKSYLRAKDEERRKVDRLTRKFRPLTDDVVRAHLVGEHTIGIYPLLLDETCWLLAVDFDKKTWQKDATAFLAVCHELKVPAALERSRSGNGGHVWIFFERAIPATTARKLGCAILTRTMESRHQVGLDSYDRFFPNQDTMPKGGLGNLIALPLQKVPRANGNSVFVNAEFHPYPDQWGFLASLEKMSNDAVEAVVLEAQRRGDLIGVRISIAEDEGQDGVERPIPGPFPTQVQIIRANLVYIEKNGLSSAILNRLLRSVESFDFEEMTGVPAHEDYLWGNPAFACAALLAESFSEYGWDMRPGTHAQIGGLPLHVYEQDGESALKPCAEALLTDEAVERILENGLMPLVSLKGQDAVRIVRFQSIVRSN